MPCLRAAVMTTFFLLVTGCGNRSALKIKNQDGISGIPTASEAAVTAYRYAFTAIVVDARTGMPVPGFAAGVVSDAPSVLGVINALGDRNGVFHVSRLPTPGEKVIDAMPVVVTAPGYEPLTRSVEIGANCTHFECAGTRPVVLPLRAATAATPPKTDKTSQALLLLKGQRPASPGEIQGFLDLLKGEKIGATLGSLDALLPYVQTTVESKPLFASVVPFFASLEKKSTQTPLTGVLTQALRDPAFFDLLTGKTALHSDKNVTFVLGYLQPLIQGLGSKNGPELSVLFNALLKKEGVLGLKDLMKSANAQAYAPLLPFVEPLVRGLNSEDAEKLASMLEPLLKRVDPAGALKGLLTNKKTDSAATVALGVFPSLPGVLGQSLGGKQALALEIFRGVLSGQLKSVKVVQDLQGLPGFIVQGSPADLTKLANLAPVQKIVALPH